MNFAQYRHDKKFFVEYGRQITNNQRDNLFNAISSPTKRPRNCNHLNYDAKQNQFRNVEDGERVPFAALHEARQHTHKYLSNDTTQRCLNLLLGSMHLSRNIFGRILLHFVLISSTLDMHRFKNAKSNISKEIKELLAPEKLDFGA